MSNSFITIGVLSFLPAVCSAQIFINTGNPNINKYKSENPNAVIWESGKNVPVPANTPVEPEDKIKPAPKTVTPPVVKESAPLTAPAVSNNAAGDYPPNAVPGKCYARCLAPDKYEYREEQVIDKPATFKIEKIAAKYETVYDTLIVKPATVKTVTISATYETVTEKVLVTPARQEWVKGKADVNCLSQNPKDCEVWCLKEIPAVYETKTRKIEKTPATTRQEQVPAITKVMPRKKMIEPARENKIEIPATYKTVAKKVLVEKGGYQEWREVLCDQDVTDTRIKQIQEALRREGYDPGPIDNKMGAKTKDALIKFQQDKGLPVGNLNIETVKALGVK